ncbi:hypothetical protein CR513_49663, partial [Mucuna pruriens]
MDCSVSRTRSQTSKATCSRPTGAQQRSKPWKWREGQGPRRTRGQDSRLPAVAAMTTRSLMSPAQSYGDEGATAWAGGVNIPQGPRVKSWAAE